MLLIPVLRFQWRVWLREISHYWQCWTKFKQALCASCLLVWCSQRRTQKFKLGVSFSGLWWQILYALSVTSQFDVIIIFPNQRFSKVYWCNMHALLRRAFSYFMCHWTEYKLSALVIRISEENKLNSTNRAARWPVFVKSNALGWFSAYTLILPRVAYILVFFHVFVCSLLLRCMFKV